MTNVFYYSLSVNFQNGLYNNQLNDEINETIIDKICLCVDTNDDTVIIKFNLDLNEIDIEELNQVVSNYVPTAPLKMVNSDYFCMDHPELLFEVYHKANFTVLPSVVNYLDDFIKVVGQSNLFNNVTGIFTGPEKPTVMLYNISIKSNSNTDNTLLKIRMCNNSNVSLFGNNSVITQGDYFGVLGSGGLMTSSDIFKYSLETDGLQDMICDITLKFIKILC